VDRNLALAHRLGVQGTPTLVWADGSRTDGYVDRAVLEARLSQVSREVRP
jgi:thiol:disulfide interchange protein DsbC